MSRVRPPAVAGMFYPGEPRLLEAQLDELLGNVERSVPPLAIPKALIAPHAGYIYSGPVAAQAFDTVAAGRGLVRRVVMLGPAHRAPVRGLALPSVESFATPLGVVPIDSEAVRCLLGLRQVNTSDAAHAAEHALEVQLPFLQRVLGRFSLVPLAVGSATAGEVAEVIERLWGAQDTMLLISTDLSHYHPYQEAKKIDAATLERIAGFATDIGQEEACGATPLNGLLTVARRKGLSIKLLASSNSGDTAGSRNEVVGYAALALYESGGVTQAGAGKTLVSLARSSIEGALFRRAAAQPTGAWLEQAGASFVTLLQGGELRGCIGSLSAVRALRADVTENALGAAFRDPRFNALSGEEWPRCRVEVSLLSPPRRLRFSGEEELLSQLRPGEDGVVLEAGSKRATFLPQVWEELPDRRQFISELMRKAGLRREHRLAHCSVSRYRVAKWTQ